MQFYVISFSFSLLFSFIIFYYLQYRYDFFLNSPFNHVLSVLEISTEISYLPNIFSFFFFFSLFSLLTIDLSQRMTNFRFFKKYPEYQRYFTAFMDTPLNELPANKRFQAHCASVITALNNVIDFLHDPGLMEASLIGLVERHKKRGQTKEEFQVREWKLEYIYIYKHETEKRLLLTFITERRIRRSKHLSPFYNDYLKYSSNIFLFIKTIFFLFSFLYLKIYFALKERTRHNKYIYI